MRTVGPEVVFVTTNTFFAQNEDKEAGGSEDDKSAILSFTRQFGNKRIKRSVTNRTLRNIDRMHESNEQEMTFFATIKINYNFAFQVRCLLASLARSLLVVGRSRCWFMY
jgi:hypothetical protein